LDYNHGSLKKYPKSLELMVFFRYRSPFYQREFKVLQAIVLLMF